MGSNEGKTLNERLQATLKVRVEGDQDVKDEKESRMWRLGILPANKPTEPYTYEQLLEMTLLELECIERTIDDAKL